MKANSSQSSSEVSNSYNTSVTNTLGSNSLAVTGGKGKSVYGDIINFSDAFKSQDVYNYVSNSGAGGSASGNPTQSQNAGGGLLDAIGKWLPWIAAAVGLYLLFRFFKR